MINIKNNVRKIKINEKKLITDAQKILDHLKYSDFDLGVLLTTNKTIHRYNKDFRHKDKPTDILSFAYHAKLKAGERIKAKTQEDKNLGDLIISLEYVNRDAKKYKQTLEHRMEILLVHGICHLLGHDHEKDEDYVVMDAQERKLLKLLHS